MSATGVYEVEREAVEAASWRWHSGTAEALDGWVTVAEARGEAGDTGTLLVWEQKREGSGEEQISGVLFVGELSIPLASELARRGMELARRSREVPPA